MRKRKQNDQSRSKQKQRAKRRGEDRGTRKANWFHLLTVLLYRCPKRLIGMPTGKRRGWTFKRMDLPVHSL